MQQLKEQHPLGRAVKQVIMLGATIWGAGHAIEAKQPQIAELFSTRASHSQRYTGDLEFGSRSERANNIEVTYRGKSIAAIPASSFSQPQRGFDQAPVSQANSHTERQANRTKHNAGYGERWMDPRVRLASMSSSTEAHRNEPILPFTTFDQLSPLAAAVVLPGKWNKRRMMLFASMMAILASCASPALIPPVIETLPGPVVGITPAAEVMGTPLVNEVLTSTPAPRIETPVVTGGSYPTEVSVMESPKVYSYGGPEGRENMDEITRQMFDRYIAELAREGKIQGTTPEALYINFDKKYDFKMFVTDDMLTRLIQGKSGGEFLVPENMDGQVYRDLQLPYDTLFQSGVLVDVGSDTFNLREFQADRIGGVGAWPVFVHVDAQSIPVSWVNMDSGGIETPIQVASTVATSIPEASATPSGITVDIGGETITVNTTVAHSETTKNLNVDPAKVQIIEGLIVYTDPATNSRYLWNANEKANAWVPELLNYGVIVNPDGSLNYENFYNVAGAPLYDMALVEDNTTGLSTLLYEAEHPELIPDGAVEVHNKVNVVGDKYYIGFMRENQFQYPDAYDGTKVTLFEKEQKDKQPFGWAGIFRVKEKDGKETVVLSQARRNGSDPNKKIPVFFGFDRPVYENYLAIGEGKVNEMKAIIENNDVEVLIVMPSPSGKGSFSPDSFQFGFGFQLPNPSVARLQSQADFSMFTPEEQAAILKAFDIWNSASNKFSSPEQSFSADISELPEEISWMIVYPGLQSWMPLH